jgi:hypothetical protein
MDPWGTVKDILAYDFTFFSTFNFKCTSLIKKVITFVAVCRSQAILTAA